MSDSLTLRERALDIVFQAVHGLDTATDVVEGRMTAEEARVALDGTRRIMEAHIKALERMR